MSLLTRTLRHTASHLPTRNLVPRAAVQARTLVTLEKNVYTAVATSTGGRNGTSRTDDGKLDIVLATPKELGGNGAGVNPEQLFASGYSACFLGAMGAIARMKKVALPASTTVKAHVTIGKPVGREGFGLAVVLDVNAPGLAKEIAAEVVHAAHEFCPYSLAIKGNIEVKLNIV
ncbi:organic hydroperoxide resistance protein [Blyttiomyces helicus]|uniref:Organic hydroperoxide resistance protein n=1 Tax=Blyttiomyces helicus TaxID=388810 RepID=A0A4P9WKD5_9FUNG|nr:organic hydroperoxide resistance protein [Blyttiomyces helicus]|eukprot:RKO92028.1 organic hydroperoxide resistance protein [Blyttiomyces helicus]